MTVTMFKIIIVIIISILFIQLIRSALVENVHKGPSKIDTI